MPALRHDDIMEHENNIVFQYAAWQQEQNAH